MPAPGVRSALLASVHADEGVALRALEEFTDLGVLVELARIHRVSGLLHDRLSRLDGPVSVEVRKRLNEQRMRAIDQELLAVATLGRLTELLDVRFLVFKGPVLAARCYGRLGLRDFSDVDVLVLRPEFATALTALSDGGYRELASNWDGFLEHGVAEVPLADRRGVVDLHWHPIALRADRRALRLDPEALFERAMRVDVRGTEIDTFDPEDTLLHLCVNAGLGGARKLLQLVDVDRVVRRLDIDWDVFVDRSHDGALDALCAGVLQRTCALLGTPIAESVLERLEPFPGWLLVNQVVDGRRSPRRLDRGIASGLVLAGGRATPWRTTAAMVRRAREAARAKLGKPRLTDPGGGLDWRHSAGAARDAVDRGSYLAWVEASAPVDAE